MNQKGERVLLEDRREVLVTNDLGNGFVRVINEEGLLEVIHENQIRQILNAKDFPGQGKKVKK